VGIPYEAVHLADVARGGVRTEAFPLDDLRDDLRAIERLGVLTGREAAAQRVVRTIRARLAALARDAAHTRRLTAFVSLGGMGSAGGGSYVDELLGLANLHNITGGVKRPWVMFSPEDLLHAQPDVIIVPTAVRRSTANRGHSSPP